MTPSSVLALEMGSARRLRATMALCPLVVVVAVAAVTMALRPLVVVAVAAVTTAPRPPAAMTVVAAAAAMTVVAAAAAMTVVAAAAAMTVVAVAAGVMTAVVAAAMTVVAAGVMTAAAAGVMTAAAAAVMIRAIETEAKTQSTSATHPSPVPLGATEVPAELQGLTTGNAAAGPWRRLLSSIGTRILLSYLILLALSTGVSVLFMRQILILRLDEQINDGLVQEYEEFRSLVGGNNPETGVPFGSDVRSIFDVYFERNVPHEGEAVISVLADGQPYRSQRNHDAGYRLENQPGLARHWAGLTATEQREMETPLGPARYLAVPIVIDGTAQGTFVVANFPAFERGEIDDVMRVAIAVGGGVLLIALLLGWSLAGRVLGPLRVLTSTSPSITESDLSQRIPMRGSDEVAQLSRTFNEMLDRLEAAFSTRRQFVDDAGHELRTPITIIRGHLELLEEDPEHRAEVVALVMDELDRMSRMVNDLLILAKAEQPDFLALEAVDVELLTREVLTKATAIASREWELEHVGRGRIVADRQRLTQALINLLQNAATYTEEDQRIAVGSVVADGEARFWVRDSGKGIAHGEQERIFERFSRGSAGSRSSDGAGLGLAIVRAIAEAHHGRIDLYSRPGAGATFTIIIPTDEPLPEPTEVGVL